MTRPLAAVAIGLACSILASGPRAQPVVQPAPGIDTRLMLDVLEVIRQREPFAGTIVISKNGRVVLAHSFGLADLRRRTRDSIRTQYRLNSLTSVFTAVGLAQLQDRGLLSLDASVCRYVPRCPKAWRPITVEMLFGPATGLRKLPGTTGGAPRSVDEYVDALRRQPLNFVPGTKWPRADPKLSSGASPRVLAVYVLEQVSKEPWLVYLRDRVFRPSGMTDAELDLGASARRATGYVRAKGRIVPAPSLGARGPVAPDVLTGLRGTALDLIRFEHALEGGRLMSPRGLEFLSTITLAVERERGVGWSCCWLVGRTPDGAEVDLHGAHSGLPDGFYGGFARYPGSRLAFAFLTNLGGNDPVWSAFDVLGVIGRGLYPPVLALAPGALAAYAGRYRGATTVRGRRWTLRLDVSVAGRGLDVSAAEPISKLRLLPATEDGFFDRLNPESTFHFLRTGDGRVDRLEVRLPWLPTGIVLQRAH